MKFGRYGWSYRLLRWGLGFVFLWIGIDILRHPEVWIGYLPESVPLGIDRAVALKFNGIFDVALGALFFVGQWPRVTALLAVVHLIAILVTQGIDAVIVRDAGLLGAALALLAWPQSYRRKRLWPFRRHSTGAAEE